MDQDRDPEHSPSAPIASGAPKVGYNQEAYVQPAPRMSSSPAAANTISSSTEHMMATQQVASVQDVSGPVDATGALPSATAVTAAAPFPPGPSVSVPASRFNDSPPRSTPRNPIQQTSLSFEDPDIDRRNGPPLPPLPHDLRARNSRIGIERPLSPGPCSGIDYIVPVDEKATREKTVGERLQPTLLTAVAEKDKYAFKAKMTGYTLNCAIGLQVLLGALTTGLSTVTTGHQTSIMTAILGGLATLSASYLARARGSNEPELSITRVKDLEQFIRECEAFQMDHGHTLGDKYDGELGEFRHRFEELLGNANG
ncbi:hypothetical protein H0H87_001929 [Tephrocybe sp. NHM501043]|nr:hypothetical protein H0H87_001929 [Tephrocybe sp. NHM501043]